MEKAQHSPLDYDFNCVSSSKTFKITNRQTDKQTYTWLCRLLLDLVWSCIVTLDVRIVNTAILTPMIIRMGRMVRFVFRMVIELVRISSIRSGSGQVRTGGDGDR